MARRSLSSSEKPGFPCPVRAVLCPVKCRQVTLKKKRVETFRNIRYPVGRIYHIYIIGERERANLVLQLDRGVCIIIGRAGASPPSVTTWTRCLYNIYIYIYIYIWYDRPDTVNVSTRFFFTVTCRHFTGHNTALTGQGKPGFSEEERERRATESDEIREARLRRTLERASCF